MAFLVDDVLLEIFSMLDEQALINARKVSQRWMNLIDQNSWLYQDVVLKIDAGLHTKKALQKYRDLCYQNIDVNLHGTYFPEEILEYHKENIKIANFNFGVWEKFTTNASRFANLEKLSFKCNHNKQSGTPRVIMFQNLKELNITIEDAVKSNIEPKILAPKLKKLSMKSQTPTEKFLKNYPNLKYLKFDNFLHERNKFSLPELSQKLISLDVDLMISKKCFDLNFKQFLSTQKDNLKFLRILSENFSNEIEFAIFEMNIENLTITIPETFQNTDKVNKTIKHLSLELYNKDTTENALNNIEKIFQTCLNIEKLTIQSEEENIEYQILKVSSKYLKNLKHLQIKFGLGEFDSQLNLNSIEEILINEPINICRVESFLNLILSCKNLKKIQLEGDDEDFMDEISITSENFLKILKELKYLEEISVNFGFKLSAKVVDFITKQKLNLKFIKLEIDHEIFEEQKKLSKILSEKNKIQCKIIKKN